MVQTTYAARKRRPYAVVFSRCFSGLRRYSTWCDSRRAWSYFIVSTLRKLFNVFILYHNTIIYDLRYYTISFMYNKLIRYTIKTRSGDTVPRLARCGVTSKSNLRTAGRWGFILVGTYSYFISNNIIAYRVFRRRGYD